MKQQLSWLLALSIGAGATLGACSQAVSDNHNSGTNNGGSSGQDSGSAGQGGPDNEVSPPDTPIDQPLTGNLTICQTDPVLVWTINNCTPTDTPTLAFEVCLDSQPAPLDAQWRVDRAEIGSFDGATFTPRGNVAGSARITATVGGMDVSTTVTVKIEEVQNGTCASVGYCNPNDPGQISGCNGVGGEGPGGPVDAAIQTLLEGPTTGDASLKWLYPYDRTVWPLGILAPLLQWTQGTAPAEAVYIRLSSDNYDYKGFFGRPPSLGGAPLVRHPIPQSAWKSITTSNAGGSFTASIVVVAGGKAYGPIAETWGLASGPLKGVVYYQSYGTDLVTNSGENAYESSSQFGAATLAIRGSSTVPELIAGVNGGGDKCRVCHSVSASGGRMIVGRGGAENGHYRKSSSYNLQTNAETEYSSAHDTKFNWVGLTPDGVMGLGNAAPFSGGDPAASKLYNMDTGQEVPTTGLANVVVKAGFPSFSPDGTMVAFNLYEKPSGGTFAGDSSELVVMAFDRMASTFSDPRLLFKSQTNAKSPGWPAFLPTNSAVVFSVQDRAVGGQTTGTQYSWCQKYHDGKPLFMYTWCGGRGELWWADIATGIHHTLDRANGKIDGVSYLPSGPNNHNDDTTLNYEPTVNPIVSGGFAWVVFMSRRMYGNVAAIDPWTSDPRYYDHKKDLTPKKLWVAAIDVNAAPGTDPSFPAFYLPAQELHAGNTRGFWVPDPCKDDGNSCESGDECCGGFCQMSGNEPVCMNQPDGTCSKEYEKCDDDSTCCQFPSDMVCINGWCAVPAQIIY